jgi:hypothetical protein
MSLPEALSSVAFLTTAIVGDGFILFKDADSILINIF